MPRTNARIPSPSARAAPMIMFVRITAAASGLRPIANEDFEPDEWESEPRYEEERAHDDEHDLATEHVPPETERQREDPEELAGELDEPDEQEDRAQHELEATLLREPGEVEPALQIAQAVLSKPLGLVKHERDDRQAEVRVVVGGRRVEPLDLSDERHDGKPVRGDEEDQERAEDRQIPQDARTADAFDEVREALNEQLDEVLKAVRPVAHRARHHERECEQNGDDDQHCQVHVRVAEVKAHPDSREVEPRPRLPEVDERRPGELEGFRYVGIRGRHRARYPPLLRASARARRSPPATNARPVGPAR